MCSFTNVQVELAADPGRRAQITYDSWPADAADRAVGEALFLGAKAAKTADEITTIGRQIRQTGRALHQLWAGCKQETKQHGTPDYD